MKTFILLLVVSMGWTAQARLGETEEQLAKRYGVVVKVETNGEMKTLDFNFGEYLIVAKCRGGKSVAELAYLKKKGVDFAEDVALAVAAKMTGSTNWIVLNSEAWEKTWVTGTNGFYASFSNVPGRPKSILVSTVVEMRRAPKSDPSQSASAGF